MHPAAAPPGSGEPRWQRSRPCVSLAGPGSFVTLGSGWGGSNGGGASREQLRETDATSSAKRTFRIKATSDRRRPRVGAHILGTRRPIAVTQSSNSSQILPARQVVRREIRHRPDPYGLGSLVSEETVGNGWEQPVLGPAPAAACRKKSTCPAPPAQTRRNPQTR